MDRSIVQKAAFSSGRMHDSTADMLGELYWGATPNGTPVNTTEAAIAAINTFSKSADAGILPRMPQIPDDIIRKAIFGIGNGPDGAEMSASAYREETQKLRDELNRRAEAEAGEIKKALTAATSQLMHVIADQDVTFLYKRPYPIQALIPTEANKGKTANFDIIGPYDFGAASFGTEDQSFTESDIITYNRSQVIKYLYAVGRVTKAAQLAGLAQIPARDVVAIRIDAAQDALRALRERAILGVDLDVTSTTNLFRASAGANDQWYNGLYQIITANTTGAGGNQCWITSNGNTYDQIMVDLDQTYRTMVKFAMEPNLAICDYRTFGIIRRGLMEYFRTEPVKEFTQGVSKINLVFPSSMGLPLVPHPFLPMGATYGAIMLVDTRLVARRSLWQDMYEELAKINLSQKFVISAAETLVDKSDVDASHSLHGGVFSIA